VNTHQPDTSGVGDEPIGEATRSSRPVTRRQVMGAGLAGAAISLGAAHHAAAQETTDPTTAPTPPDAPTSGDIELLAFAVGIELAVRDLYRDAVAAGATTSVDGTPNLFQVIADNHGEYASVMAGDLGVSAGTARNSALYDEWTSKFAVGDAATVAVDAYELESVLVATHTNLIGEIEGLRAAETIASILVPEARHCAILTDVAGQSSDLDMALADSAEPLSPESAVGASS
jgi:hypothetical protein